MQNHWHSFLLDDVFKKLETSESGLSQEEVLRRLKKYGQNTLPQEKPYPKVKLFLNQFASLLIYILIFAFGVSIYLKHYSDAVFIIIVLLINTTVGFYQENKANNSLRSLKKMVRVSAKIIREGNQKEIDSSELVPGDIIRISAGDKVPADARIIKSKNLKSDESSITGEWIATEKKSERLDANTQVGNRSNMILMGTIIEEGEGEAVVTGTGKRTEVGEITTLLKQTKEKRTPLQKKISSLSRIIGAFILFVVFIVIAIGYFNGESFSDIFVTSLALTVSAVPAGLLPTITVILTLGMRRILKQNGLVRKLIATETLGSVTVICTDKTGTLTESKMQVSHILTGNRELLKKGSDPISNIKDSNGAESHILALKIAIFANDAFIENPEDEFHDWIVRGRSTERALLIAATHAGLSGAKLNNDYSQIDHLGFDSNLKYSASLRLTPTGKNTVYIMGAPEALVNMAVSLHIDGKIEKLDSKEYRQLSEKIESLTQKGLRVIACAYREINPKDKLNKIPEKIEGLTLVGFVALKDPLRADAKESIGIAKRAGIRSVIITGDHKYTAQAIANEVGIYANEEQILEGKDLDLISDQDLASLAKSVSIYARVSPHHKLRIVAALQSNNEIVAMVGDGVNDAPAIKLADVGVAVGSGSDVAKEAADIVLLDNSFKTIVTSIEQGRVIFQNVRKVFVYLVADDFSELFLFLVAMSFGMPLPLLAAQILWINLVEDGLPSIALTTEQETRGVMEEKPRNPKEPILNKEMKLWLVSILFIAGIASFILFLSLLKITGDLNKTRTIVFALMCLDSLIFSFSVRSFSLPIFRKDIFNNRLLVGAVACGLVLLLGAIYFAPLQKILSTEPLHIFDWIIIISVSVVEIALVEFAKLKIFAPKRKNS